MEAYIWGLLLLTWSSLDNLKIYHNLEAHKPSRINKWLKLKQRFRWAGLVQTTSWNYQLILLENKTVPNTQHLITSERLQSSRTCVRSAAIFLIAVL